MKKSSRRDILVIGACLVIASGLYFGFAYYHPPSARAVPAKAAANVPAPTLDPVLFMGPVRDSYQIARDNPALLAQLHCYCGCDRVEGHKNLLDCFRDTHGSRCEICVGEVLQAARMFDQGAPVEQIRDALRARYYHQG